MPLLVLATDRTEGETADGEGDDDGAEPVELAGRVLVTGLGHVPAGRVEGEQDDRDVDEERCPPRDVVDEDAPEGRAEDRCRGRCRRPDPEGTATLGAFERRGDDRQGTGHEQCAGRSLQDPEEDERLEARGESTEDRDDPERHEADGEDPSAAVEVGQGAGKDQERGEDGEVAAHHVRLAFEHTDDGRRQLLADPRQCHSHDRRVEEDGRRSEDGGEHRPTLACGHGFMVPCAAPVGKRPPAEGWFGDAAPARPEWAVALYRAVAPE